MICLRLFAGCVLVLFINVPAAPIAADPSRSGVGHPPDGARQCRKDLPTLSRLMAHDADIIRYAVAGRKAHRLDGAGERNAGEFINSQARIPIHELRVWTKEIWPGTRWNWTISAMSPRDLNGPSFRCEKQGS